jgi:outer membrane protein
MFSRSLQAGRRSLAAGTLALLTLAGTAYAEMRIAVVDTQRAMMETEDGLRMQANLKKYFESKQRDLNEKQQQLEAERADIEKQKGVLSQDALQRRADEWQQAAMALQQSVVQFNQELQAKQSEQTKPIYEKVMGLIDRLAKQEGYDMVVDRQAVPYVRGDLEVTDRIITMYNSGAAPSPGAAPATAPAPGGPAAAPTAAPGATKPVAPVAPPVVLPKR